MNRSEQLLAALEIASHAPSVHNTQPWKVSYDESTIRIFFNTDHLLIAGDPTGREGWISLGCFIETLLLVLPAKGIGVDNVTSQYFDKKKPIYIIHYSVVPPTPNQELINSVLERFTDRSVYKPALIGDELKSKLSNSWKSPNVQIVVSDDKDLIELIAKRTSQGITIALGNPSFRKELSTLINSSLSNKKRGIPGFSLELSPLRSLFEKRIVKHGLGIKQQARKEYRGFISSSAVVLLFSKGDTPQFWLEAGQAYQRVSLAIQQSGLSQATTAAVVEAADFHLDIEKIVATKYRLQAVLRIGRGRKNSRPTPREAISELLT